MLTPHSLTVQDLLRQVLPIGTRVAAGRMGLRRTVAWPSILQTRPPAFPDLEGRELALLSIETLRMVSETLTLADLIVELAGSDVAAIGVLGTIDNRAIEAAESTGLPLLGLPIGTVLRQIEREVMRVLVEPNFSIDARSQQIHDQLLQLSMENLGMAALIGAIADSTGRTTVVQDKRLETLVAVGDLYGTPAWTGAIEPILSQGELLPAAFQDRNEVARLAPSPATMPLGNSGINWLVAPIVASRLGRGFFSLLSDSDSFDALDIQFVRHGASVCALEMAKAKAIREAQKRVQGSILEQLLNNAVPIDQALRHLSRLGHVPQERLYAALAARWTTPDGSPASSPSLRRLETMFNEQVTSRGQDALVQALEDEVVVFCNVEGDEQVNRKTGPRAARQLAESIQERARLQYPQTPLIVGIGRPATSIEAWRSSYLEAIAAQRMAVQWRVGTPLFFSDLGVYRLLSLLMETPELRSFYQETLGDLLTERESNDELLRTLEVFFEEDGNLSQTAKKLNVHRNTLIYRMERVAQIGSFDLDNPETRLAVNLALKIRRLLAAPGSSGRMPGVLRPPIKPSG